jgi:anthranilate synthase component I
MLSLDDVKPLLKRGNAIPVYREFLPDLDTPITALLKLRRHGTRAFLLESVEIGEKLARYSFLGRNPVYVFRSRDNRIEISGAETKTFEGEPLQELRSFLGRFQGVDVPDLPPFSGGAVGFMCYDAIRLIENIPAQGRDDYQLPDLDFGFYDAFVVFDHLKQRLLLVALVLPEVFGGVEAAYAHTQKQLAALEAELMRPLEAAELQASLPRGSRSPGHAQNNAQANALGDAVAAARPGRAPEWSVNMTQDQFLGGVAKCKEYIAAGDAFQIVLSQRYACKPGIDAFSIYRSLRTVNPSPYMYYLDYGSFEVVGASPETLVKVQNGHCETVPIAGTRRRGKTEDEDIALEKELLADPKERAEHVMLVDLGRNDIGRVSVYGSVKVKTFMQVMRHSHVMHITSVVEGQLKPELHALDALMSCLPAGTLSGAPKIRAMEIIDGLEPTRRGLYGGAICYLDFRGNLDSCIAIRTMVMQDGIAYVQTGAGIVADSVPQLEYEECGHKAGALRAAVAKALEHLTPPD